MLTSMISAVRPQSSSSEWGPLSITICVALAYLLAVVVFKDLKRQWVGTKSFHESFRRYFGSDYQDLPTHEKEYPGYDLASVHRALASLMADEGTCVQSLGVGGFRHLSDLFRQLKLTFRGRLKPNPPAHERIPVNLGEEESFASSNLWLATFFDPDSSKADVPRKIAIFLCADFTRERYAEVIDGSRVPHNVLVLSIACRERATADWFFAEIERRRRRLSIFRGKLIDPQVGVGGVRSIGFRAIKRVIEQDLVLTEEVKSLIHGSIVGFYRHGEVLRSVGVEMKRGILLHGPPGTGKTSISLYLAGLLPDFTICFVSGEQLLYPREICRMARYLQPAMIVFEDIDLIAEQRDTNGLATVLGELMNQIDGCEPDDQVLFIMNTNSLERLEAAVRNRPGRVDQIIQLPLPDAAARQQLIRYFARNIRLPGGSLDQVIGDTEGATPAMLKELVKRATVNAVERMDGHAKAIEILESDLLLAAAQVEKMRELRGARISGFAGAKKP